MMDEHTPPTPDSKSALENIGFVWTVEKGSSGKGPIRRKNKIPDDSKKGIFAFLLFTMVSEAIPIIMMSWLPYFSSFHFTTERGNFGVGYCYLYLVHKYAELLNNMVFKCLFVELKNK